MLQLLGLVGDNGAVKEILSDAHLVRLRRNVVVARGLRLGGLRLRDERGQLPVRVLERPFRLDGVEVVFKVHFRLLLFRGYLGA